MKPVNWVQHAESLYRKIEDFDDIDRMAIIGILSSLNEVKRVQEDEEAEQKIECENEEKAKMFSFGLAKSLGMTVVTRADFEKEQAQRPQGPDWVKDELKPKRKAKQ